MYKYFVVGGPRLIIATQNQKRGILLLKAVALLKHIYEIIIFGRKKRRQKKETGNYNIYKMVIL